MAKATSPSSLDALLAQAGQVATKAKPKSGKKEPPVVIIDERDTQLLTSVRDMIRLLTLHGEVSEVLKSHKQNAMDLIFQEWVAQCWEERKAPENPRMSIKKKGSAAIDMSVVFQVKHRSDGIQLPEELKPGQTILDHILMELTSDVVGLSDKNATKLVQDGAVGEVLVTTEFFMPDFNSMLKSNDAEILSGAEKIFRYLMGASAEDIEEVTLEERAKILQKRQVVRLKEGFIDRAFTYCDNADQLSKLLKYVRVGLAVSDPKFAEGDKRSDQIARMQDTVQEFLGAEVD